jgi:hypothetical protein
VQGFCCTPTLTCADVGYACGEIFDGCQVVSCGSCHGHTVCFDGSCCLPTTTCADVGATCGFIDSGCGPTFCGDCAAGEACMPDNHCGPAPRFDADCLCRDGTLLTSCAVTDCFSANCVQACMEQHFGVFDVMCNDAAPSCTSTDDPPFVPPFGANLLGCQCANGTERSACADVDCSSSSAQQTLCATACSARGGLTGTVCSTGDATCVEPPPPPPGTSSLSCTCQDGTNIQYCAQVDCTSGPAQDQICGPACQPHGGEQATACFANAPSCAAP